MTGEELAKWLQEFGEQLQGGEQREWQERLLGLGRLQEGELCRVAEVVGRRLERENRSQAPKDEAEVWLERGYECYRAEDFEGAIANFDKAINIKPNDHEIWNDRGSSLHNLGQYEDAIASYDKALDLKPNLHEAWLDRGILLGALERYEDAIASYDKALDIEPDDHAAWNSRGFSLSNLGRYEDAIASYDKALNIEPKHYKAWNNRGFSLSNLGRYEDAIASYDKALDGNPKLHQAWNNRGNLLRNLGRYEAAIANYDQGLTYVLKENNPEGWGILHHGKGNAYFYQGQINQNIQAAKIYYSQAITTYNTARQTLESFPKSYLELIQDLIKAHLGLGNSEIANQWRITGLEVFRQLIDAQSTPLQKRNLETKFSSFSRITVDSLVKAKPSSP